jgi:hypothetical protein
MKYPKDFNRATLEANDTKNDQVPRSSIRSTVHVDM